MKIKMPTLVKLMLLQLLVPLSLYEIIRRPCFIERELYRKRPLYFRFCLFCSIPPSPVSKQMQPVTQQHREKKEKEVDKYDGHSFL